MGFSLLSMALLAGSAITGLSSAQTQAQGARVQSTAAADQARGEIAESRRQEVEVVRQGQEQKSDRARQADSEFASMTVAMETLGASGSINEARLGREVHSVKELDQKRIEDNRDREVLSIRAKARAAQQRGNAAIELGEIGVGTASLNALGTFIDLGGSLVSQRNTRRKLDVVQEAARGRTAIPLGGR